MAPQNNGALAPGLVSKFYSILLLVILVTIISIIKIVRARNSD